MTYPISEVMSVGTAMLAGQIAAVIITLSATAVGGGDNYNTNVPIFFTILLAFPILTSLFVKEDLKKLNAGKGDSMKTPLNS